MESRLSFQSRNSVLSLWSHGSVLSIGSVGSALSIGSVGSFASFLSIEVVDEKQVQIRYRDGPTGEGDYKTLRACGQTICTLDQFYSWINKYYITMDERTTMCHRTVIQ